MTVRNNKVMTMNNRLSATFAISAASFVMPVLVASIVAISISAHADQRINNVSVVQTAPEVTQLRLGFSDTPVLPAAYQLNDPSRLVLNFEQVQNGLVSRFTDYNIGMVNEITTLNNDSTTRMIVGLKQTGEYTTVISGNELLLSIMDPSGLTGTVANTPVVTSPIVTAPIATTAIVTPIIETSVDTTPIKISTIIVSATC